MNNQFKNVLAFTATAMIAAVVVCSPYQQVTRGEGGTDDCLEFGNAPFPIWSHLTALEIHTLATADSARAGNPDALLGLALFASGDVRDSATFQIYVHKVRAFVDTACRSMANKGISKELGRALYADISRTFYGAAYLSDELSGYEFDQSRLSEMLRGRHFNCISSALLCAVIYRYFGFEVHGVILPSHSFLQITLPGGGICEIETTTKPGFDFKHDEAYFKGGPSSWTGRRKLPPVTLADYRRRRIVSAFELVCSNMNNQHTMNGRMAPCDQHRLNEVLDHLIPGDRLWQSNRWTVYNNAFIALQKSGDFATAQRMFDKVGTAINAMAAAWKTDTAMLDNFYLIEICRAVTLVKNNRLLEGRLKADTVVFRTSGAFKNHQLFINNALWIYNECAHQLIAQNRFEEARTVLAGCPAALSEKKEIRSGNRYLYEAWGASRFMEEDFRAAINLNFEALRYADSTERKTIVSNIGASYSNLCIPFMKKNDKDRARTLLRECLGKLPECGVCSDRLKTLE